MNKKVLGLALAGVITASSVLPTVSLATKDVKIDSAVTTEVEKRTTTAAEKKEMESLAVTRIEGADRYKTAVEASKKTFPKGAKYVAIATGENFIDGLVGGALTSQEGFPLLLVRKNSISKEILDEIKRLKPEEIFIYGGDAAVSKDVEKELKKFSANVERLAGEDRYDTAGKIEFKRLQLSYPTAKNLSQRGAVINAFNFADALSAGPFIGMGGKNKVLNNPLMPFNTGSSTELNSIVFGGTSAIPKGTKEEHRFEGKTRYETAVEVAKAYKSVLKMDIDTVVLVSGEDFPDGLTAAEIAGEKKAAVLLTNSKNLNASTKKFIEENKNIKNVIILGGDAAVSEAVEKELKDIKVEVSKEKEEVKKEEVKKEEVKADVKKEETKAETKELKGEIKIDSAIQE